MKRLPVKKSPTVPGFKFSGISAGIKKNGEKDLGLIFSEDIAVMAGVFTTNNIKAAPVRLDIERITSKKGQAIIFNSGNANACTGVRGIKDASETANKAAKRLGIPPRLVYVSSTGIIGKPLPMDKIKIAIPEVVYKLSPYSIKDTASAMITTDTFLKIAAKKIRIEEKTGTIAGIAKGAGMICPHMATMLCFIFTDIAVKQDALDAALREAVGKSFNRLTVDNDMSTNDTVIIMANGRLNNKPITKKSVFYQEFKIALNEVTYKLAEMIAMDGEGSTKLIRILVKGARNEGDAEKVAKSIATSLLVKTAIYGNDPNWGRIMAAIGHSGVEIVENKIEIYFDKCKLVSRGIGLNKEKVAYEILAKKDLTITVDLGLGKKTVKVLTCDLTKKYIKINAAYRT